MKKYTVKFINRNTNEVVESHQTNDIEKCLKRIKIHDASGNMYMFYHDCNIKIINNETGKEKYYE